MKHLMLFFYFLSLFVVGVTTTQAGEQSQQQTAAVTTSAVEPTFNIIYDKTNDHLSIKAEAVSLKTVLARVAKVSGIEVLFDDAAEETISVDIQSEALDDGLKAMLKGRNSALRYSRDKNNKLLLVGVTVLPEGERGSGNSKRIKSLRVEAYKRASIVYTHEQLQENDISRQRWLVRMDELSPERREKLEKMVEARLEKKALSKQQLAEKTKVKTERQAKSDAKEKAVKAKKLEHLTPGELEEYHRVRAEAREQVKEQLYGNSSQ